MRWPWLLDTWSNRTVSSGCPPTEQDGLKLVWLQVVANPKWHTWVEWTWWDGRMSGTRKRTVPFSLARWSSFEIPLLIPIVDQKQKSNRMWCFSISCSLLSLYSVDMSLYYVKQYLCFSLYSKILIQFFLGEISNLFSHVGYDYFLYFSLIRRMRVKKYKRNRHWLSSTTILGRFPLFVAIWIDSFNCIQVVSKR